jgi:hypothetical protein
VAITNPGTGDVVIDANNVYWTDNIGVFERPLAGGTTVNLTATGGGGGQPFGLAVDATSVYWSDQVRGQVYRAAIGGGTPGNSACPACTWSQPNQIAVNATTLYVVDEGAGQIVAVNTQGTPAMTPLYTGLAQPTDVALDSTSVYWTELGSGVIAKGPLVGLPGNEIVLARSARPDRIILAGGFAFFLDEQTGLRRVPIEGGSPAITVESFLTNPLANGYGQLAGDADAVYYHDASGSLMKLPLCSTTPITLAPGQVYGLAVGPTLAYFTDMATGQLYDVLK